MSNSITPVIAHTETPEQELARLRKENSDLKAKGSSMKVSVKGALSVYGIGRFPVTLYKSQWLSLIEMIKSGQVEAFMAQNEALLKSKPTKAEALTEDVA